MRTAKRMKLKWGICIITLAIGLVTVVDNGYADTISSTAEECAEIARMTGDTRDPDQVRSEILSVLNQALSVAKKSESQQIQLLITQVESMGDEEILGTFGAAFITSFSKFKGLFDNLESIQSSPALPENESLVRSADVTVNLRNASYSEICGDTRLDTDTTVIALGVFLVAEAIKEAAISGCGTVVVVAGFGGSPQSAVCSGVVAGVFQVARGIWEEILLCQDSIDSAEILGTYQRAEDIFNSLNEHDTAIKAQVEQHDTDIKVQVNQHDIDIKARLDEIEGKVDYALKLLVTPQGRRPSWNEQVYP